MDVKIEEHWPEISRRFVLYRNSLVFDFEGIIPLKIVIKFFCGIFSLGRIFHLLTLDLTFVKNWKKNLCILTIFPALSINIFFPILFQLIHRSWFPWRIWKCPYTYCHFVCRHFCYKSFRCEIFGFFFLSFPQNERKIY